ncbi:MAG: hypothetical protein K1060chlam2_01082 [Chlamydiae bacterium]|nr:hypothetical protein [Chlamydiota bacterium]
MKKVHLKNISSQGQPLQATFLPEGGMNLISYRLGEIEVIDQKTKPLFKERMAGLGALIGPHFHHRQNISIEPFSHGIARYVPWKYVSSDTQIKAHLHGSDLYKGTSLAELEGQDFKMSYEARLLERGLFIELKIESAFPSVVGLHTYYALRGRGLVRGEVQPTYRDQDEWKALPKEWTNGSKNRLHFSLPQKADFGFIPAMKTINDHDYRMILDTEDYSLHLDFNSASDKEISCQLYHPEGSSYLCIEPLSARSPQSPILTRSTLEVKLEIFPQTS